MAKKGLPQSSKQVHKQPQRAKRKIFVPISEKMKLITIVGIVICIVAVLVDLIAINCFAPDKLARAELEKIAATYYEDYFYDKAIDNLPKDQSFEESMAQFEKDGFAKVHLRHLLLYNNQENAVAARYFKTSAYVCDEDETIVKFTPVAPYGRQNYKVEYSLACNYK